MNVTLDNKSVHIEMTDDSPRIVLDTNEGIFKIEGPSYPEDAYELYKYVIQWIDDNQDLKTALNFDFNFNFKVLSSASHKMIYEILLKLEDLHRKTNNVIINWYYLNFDEDMHEVGEDFADTIDIPFKFFPLESTE